MSKSVIINDINNASPNVTTHIIPAIRAINKGSNYDDLGNKPIYNINLLEESFEPIEGEYYRHTGETNDTFTTGVLYYYKGGIYTPITGVSNNFACTGILEKSKWVDKSITYTEPKSLKYYNVSSYTEKVKCAGIKNNILYQFNSKGYYKTDLENPETDEFISWGSTEIGSELEGNVDPIMCTTGTYGGYGEALFILCSGDGTSTPVIIIFDWPQHNLVDYINITKLKSNISSIIIPPSNNEEGVNIWGIKDNTKLIQFGDIQFGNTDGPDKFSIDLPERINNSNLCIYNNELYITGHIKNIYKFNFDTKEITKVCTVPDYFGPSSQIDAPCYAIVINNKIYGIDGDNNLVVYDMNGTKIGEVPKILTNEDYSNPRFYCALIYHNNNLYISHCLAQGYSNPVGTIIAELKDIRYEYSIENEGIKENSATSISLNSNYPIIDATKTQGKISLISNNTPDDNKYSIIQVPTQDTGILEVLNTYRIQKISEVENDRGFVIDKQVKSEIKLFNQTYQPDWEEKNPNSVTYIKNKDNVNYTLTESDWTNDCFSLSSITLITADGEYLSNYHYINDDITQGKITLNSETKDVLVRTINYSLTDEFKHLVNNSIFYTIDGIEYKQLILNGLPTDSYISSLQYFDNTPANSGFLWLLRLTEGDDVYESTDGINYTVSTRFKNRYNILNTNGVWVSNLRSEKYNSSTRQYYQTIDYSSNNGNTWSTSTIELGYERGFEISDLQVCKDDNVTYFMGQNKKNTAVKTSSNGKDWYRMSKSYDDYKFNMIRSVGDGIFIFDVNGNLKRLHKSDNFQFVEYNNFGRPKNNSKQIDYLKYFEGRYIYSDYASAAPYYIYSFENGFTDNPTFDTATKYISHGAAMPTLKYCINGRYLGLDNTPTSTYTKVVYTDILQNTTDSRIVFDSYFTHNYLQNNRDSKIRLYKYKSAHNISRDEETGNFYSKYGEKPTIYITAIPAAVRFDLVVNEYAEV